MVCDKLTGSDDPLCVKNVVFNKCRKACGKCQESEITVNQSEDADFEPEESAETPVTIEDKQDQCEDSTNLFNFKGKRITCADVSTNFCKNGKVRNRCKATCNNCPTLDAPSLDEVEEEEQPSADEDAGTAIQCEDSTNSFVFKGNRITCADVEPKLCSNGKVRNRCKVTCNNCITKGVPSLDEVEEEEEQSEGEGEGEGIDNGFQCEDSTNSFAFKGNRITCADVEHKLCSNGKVRNRCKVTCDACPSADKETVDEENGGEFMDMSHEEIADTLFALIDTDGSECISKDELLAFVPYMEDNNTGEGEGRKRNLIGYRRN